MSSPHTNWHEAITCAIQIDLRDYSHLLEYKKEHFLFPNRNRIDLLIIRKQLDFHIPKHIAFLFRTHNLFEYKGLGTSLSTDDYYKTNGHAGYYISSYQGTNTLSRSDLTLSFPTFHYPRNLFRHLTKDCKKTIENPFPGVYYITKEMYATQVLVISELLPEDSLYLYCLKQGQIDQNLLNTLAKDYDLNKDDCLYTKYLNQLTKYPRKGDQLMVCEGLFRLYGTSSEEIREQAAEQATRQANERAEKLYVPQIQKLTSENNALTSENSRLTSELNKLAQLLAQNGIAY